MALLLLQNRLKKQPEAFEQEFDQQHQHFISKIEIFKLQSTKNSQEIKEFANLVTFISHCAPCYKKKCVDAPFQLLDLLENHYQRFDPTLRKTVVQCLIMLQNRKMISRLKLLPVLFQMFRCPDKTLRKLLFSHIVNDIKRVNRNKQNTKINNTLQNFMYTMLKDETKVAAKKSLDVMVDLWRRKVWTDAKTVNAISTACFTKDAKMMATALRFFLGVEQIDDDEEEEEHRDQNKAVALKHLYKENEKFTISSRKNKRKRAMDREKKKIQSIDRKQNGGGDEESTIGTYSALQLVYDPQTFADRLFGQLKQSSMPFEVRLMMMNVVSQLIGTHQLVLFNFYPFLQKYLQPHQRHVTQILTFVAQAAHDLIPDDVLLPVVKTLANHFVTDRSSSEIMAVGLNAIREICSRCPLAMERDLLRDLVQYKRSKEKGVMMASRSLIALYREVDPAMLEKKDRGKDASLALADGERSKQEFGYDKAATDVLGAALLDEAGEQHSGDEDDEWNVQVESDSEGDSSEEEQDFKDYKEDEDEDELEVEVEVGGPEDDDNAEMEDEETAEAEAEADESDEQKSKKSKKSVRFKAGKSLETGKTATKTVKKAGSLPVAATRILTPKDFERIKRLRAQTSSSTKRRREDGSTLRSKMGATVDEDEIVGYVKHKKLTKAERLASIHEGRDPNQKFGAASKTKGGGTTNKAKLRQKPIMMIKDKLKRKAKGLKFNAKQSKLAKHIVQMKKHKKNSHARHR